MNEEYIDEKSIPEISRYEYIKICPICEYGHEIFTQKDSFPEYYTKIYIKCRCGLFIEFILPVN